MMNERVGTRARGRESGGTRGKIMRFSREDVEKEKKEARSCRGRGKDRTWNRKRRTWAPSERMRAIPRKLPPFLSLCPSSFSLSLSLSPFCFSPLRAAICQTGEYTPRDNGEVSQTLRRDGDGRDADSLAVDKCARRSWRAFAERARARVCTRINGLSRHTGETRMISAPSGRA